MVRTLLSLVIALPLLMGCSVFAQAEDLNNMSPAHMALINETCTKVMGLRPGESYFADCQDSLAHSLARRDAAYAMSAADDSCGRQGLVPGSSAFATCMLDRQGSGAAPELQAVALNSDTIKPGKSYYDVTPTVKFQRERYSCAQIGLMPNGGLFGECVASLEGELLPDPN
jgi:hypothetical protein